MWDRMFANELNSIIDLTEQGYRQFRYRMVTKHAFNELLSLKEAYLIGKKGNPNPVLIMNFIETALKLLNPVCPHFCQHTWSTNIRQTTLADEGFPISGPVEAELT